MFCESNYLSSIGIKLRMCTVLVIKETLMSFTYFLYIYQAKRDKELRIINSQSM